MKSFAQALAAVLAVFTVTASAAVDPALPAYKTQSGISGNLTSVGSDTLNNLMALWAEQYKRYYPAVNIQIQGAGSSTAPPALIEAASNLGPMSRHMNEKKSPHLKRSMVTNPRRCLWPLMHWLCMSTRTIPYKVSAYNRLTPS